MLEKSAEPYVFVTHLIVYEELLKFWMAHFQNFFEKSSYSLIFFETQTP